MVLKKSKHGLNTGNTIRRYARESALHEHRRYGCLTVCSEVAEDESYAAQDAVRELTDMFPSTKHIGVEYSLNKQRRWELPGYMLDVVDRQFGNVDAEIKFTIRNKDGHKVYYSNLKKASRTKERDDAANGVPKYDVYVGYGPQTTAKLYKPFHYKHRKVDDLKRQLRKVCFEHVSPNIFDADGEEMPMDETITKASQSNNTSQEPMNKRSKPDETPENFCYVWRNIWKHLAEEEDNADDQVILERSTNSSPITPRQRPQTPPHTEVLIGRSDVEVTSLAQKFGKRYSEAYCTPRIFTLDISDHLGPEAKNERFYLVVMLRAEIKDVDCSRVYCSGDGISWELSPLSTAMQGVVYDISTLIDLALCHRKECLVSSSRNVAKFYSGGKIQRAVHRQVKSSDPSLVVGKIIRKLRLYYQNNDADYVFLPSMQCSICLEDINDSTLHTAVLPCQHDFCNQCWNRHLCTSIYQGLVHITCIQCNTQLDPVFIMSMVEFSTYRLFEFLLAYSFLSRGQVVKSCPAIGCERVLHCDDELAIRDDPITASCKCGSECCFKCLKEPHWPLTCDQFACYKNMLLPEVHSGTVCMPMVVQQPYSLRDIAGCTFCPGCWASTPTTPSVVRVTAGCPWTVGWKCKKEYCGWYGTLWREILESEIACIDMYRPAECIYRWSHMSHHTPTTSADYYTEAYSHRVHKLPYLRGRLRKYAREFLHKRPGNPSKQQTIQSLPQLLNQIVEQIVTTHNLLEYCCVVNVFKKGSKYCVPTISLLSYSVGVLERELSSNRCNQYTVDRLVKYYDIVKSNTHLLVRNISLALSLLQPSIGC